MILLLFAFICVGHECDADARHICRGGFPCPSRHPRSFPPSSMGVREWQFHRLLMALPFAIEAGAPEGVSTTAELGSLLWMDGYLRGYPTRIDGWMGSISSIR
ncbi:hypothetical protein BJ741DRAFT_594128 [Chytriomyces cf. hyalinus JEL632]|nr:hypothetical protein BJ741DRAFT_594128 [Chytriomyces cf. hyalinus JEL632]